MKKAYTRGLSAPWRHLYELFWPVDAFKTSVLCLLRAAHQYFIVYSEAFHEQDGEAVRDALCRLMQEAALPRGQYPEWVFARGFNPGLRASFRYFLLQMDRLIDLIVASDYAYRVHIDTETKRKVSPVLKPVVQQHCLLLEVLMGYFEKSSWQEVPSREDDLLDLVSMADTTFHQQTKTRLWMQQHQDIRDCLLRLVASLPTQAGTHE